MKAHNMAAAFAVAAIGIAFFSAMDAVMKGLALAIGTYNALLWRTLAGTMIGATLFLVRGNALPGRDAIRLHLRRGLLSAAMALLFFWGLTRVPLAQGIALSFIAPIIALYLAAVLLKETIERRAILVSLLGFAGVIVILADQAQAQPGPQALYGALAILASACLYAYNIILMRQQALVAGPVEVAFFMNLIMAVCFLFAAPVLAQMPLAGQVPAIIGAALLAFASLMLLSWAYARAEAQHLAPVEYSAFVWAALFGYLVFGEAVRPPTLIGAVLIIGACLISARARPRPAAAADAGILG